MRSLRERLNNSKNMLLLLSENTKKDTDWVPFEIAHAIDNCKIPIICAYLDITDKRLKPNPSLYPAALATRINNETAKTIHIPFHKDVIKMVIGQFSPDKLPNGSASTYVDKYYDRIGL